MGIDREESNTGSSNFVRDGRGQPRDQISFVPEIADPGQRTDAARTSYGSLEAQSLAASGDNASNRHFGDSGISAPVGGPILDDSPTER